MRKVSGSAGSTAEVWRAKLKNPNPNPALSRTLSRSTLSRQTTSSLWRTHIGVWPLGGEGASLNHSNSELVKNLKATYYMY
jgi:hypothetical protein